MSRVQVPTQAELDQFLHGSRLTTARTEPLLKGHNQAVAELAAGPAGWHGMNDIQTLKGLAGHYLWTEHPLQPARINWRFDPGHIGSQGSYDISAGLAVLEEGTFYCVPNNPAIGWAAVSLMPTSSGATQRSFIVAGMLTDNHWKVMALLLNKLGDHGPQQPAFSVVRML